MHAELSNLSSLERRLAQLLARVVDAQFGFGAHPPEGELIDALNSNPETAKILRQIYGATAHGGVAYHAIPEQTTDAKAAS